MKLKDYILEVTDGKHVCPVCKHAFKKLGLSSHFHTKHNPKYVNKRGFDTTRGAPWNKGLTKETDVRVAEGSRKVSLATKGRPGQIPSLTHRENIAKSMVKAHAEGRAHNIGKSRWNNKPSYPEEFFMKVIENEFDDKVYLREHSFHLFSLDFAWVHKKLCIEIDGDQHQRFEEYRERDARKDAALVAEGWKVLRIVWKDMYGEPKHWITIAKEFVHNWP